MPGGHQATGESTEENPESKSLRDGRLWFQHDPRHTLISSACASERTSGRQKCLSTRGPRQLGRGVLHQTACLMTTPGMGEGSDGNDFQSWKARSHRSGRIAKTCLPIAEPHTIARYTRARLTRDLHRRSIMISAVALQGPS